MLKPLLYFLLFIYPVLVRSASVMVSDTCSCKAFDTGFVKLYDVHGKKIIKGHYYGKTDSTIIITGKDGNKAIPKSLIGRAKYHRSTLSEILITTAIVIAVVAFVWLLVLLSKDRHSPLFKDYSYGRSAPKKKKRKDDKTDDSVPPPAPEKKPLGPSK